MFGGGYTNIFQIKIYFRIMFHLKMKMKSRNTEGYVTYTVIDGSVLIVNKESIENIKIDHMLIYEFVKGKIATLINN